MQTKLTRDEAKRAENLAKRGLDFADAGVVMEYRYRLDVSAVRNGDTRTQSFSYVFGYLRVLSVVRTDRDSLTRVISYRKASTQERMDYHEWIGSE